jgi:hypothetical protein
MNNLEELKDTIGKLTMLITEFERGVAELYEAIDDGDCSEMLECVGDLEGISEEFEEAVGGLEDVADANQK